MFSGKKSEHFNIFFILLASILWINTLQAQKTLVVDQHGKGNYKTIQEALNAVPAGNAAPVTILIKKGVYREVVIVDARKDNILLKGEDKFKTIISYNNHAGTKLANGDTLNNRTCATFFVYGNDFKAENISFDNDAGFTADIIPEGWNNWRNPANELTARYAEFNSKGPGANPESRVSWSKQLTLQEAETYTIRNIFGTWNPSITLKQ